jgi:hypothetical protein
LDNNGCIEWSTATACPSGQTCVGNICVLSCTNDPGCTSAGLTQCSGINVQTCDNWDTSDSCLEWNTATACPSGQSCVGNICVASAICGDNECNGDETCSTCSSDCGSCSCSVPDVQQSWVLSYEQEILGKLTGVTEIAPGKKITSRYSSTDRQLVRGYFQSLWEGLGLEVHVQNFGSDGANVYAVLPATVPSTEWVIFGAHYDTVAGAPGADDDGTGVTLVSAIARYATMIPCRSRNLMFVAFDKEEEGSVGAYALAQYLRNQNYNVHSFHDFEMLGWDSNDDRLYHVCRPSSGLFEMYQQVLTENPLPINLIVSAGGSSDYDAFRAYGFPIILLSEAWPGDSTPYYHTSRDAYSTIDFPYLELATNFENGVVKYLTQIN